MLEHAGGFPLEGTELKFPGGERLLLNLNVQSTDQGHATAFTPMVAQRLGIKPQRPACSCRLLMVITQETAETLAALHGLFAAELRVTRTSRTLPFPW
jgi:hypothetical protein